MTLQKAKSDLRKHANPKHAEFHQGFFKTGPGEYGEGDVFIGVRVPKIRLVAKTHRTLPRASVRKLLRSPIHEERLLALIILVHQFKRADPDEQTDIVDFYLANTAHINNWDLVDSSAHKILGVYLLDKPRKVLTKLSQSKNLWERRIAMIATMPFVDQGDFKDTLRFAKRNLKDPEDLMHKATGWLLREVGKQNSETLLDFLDEPYPKMPFRYCWRVRSGSFSIA